MSASLFEQGKVRDLHPYFIKALCNTYPTIIPIRPPILSLISRQNRHPDLTHEHIVHGFNIVANVLSSYHNVNFIRYGIDEETTKHDMDKFAKRLGLKPIDYEIPVKNETPDRGGLKERYYNGEPLPEIQNEIDMLNSMPHIKEFLLTLGYTKN